MSIERRLSAEQKAKRRNREIERRNQRKADANPLFVSAGLLEQVVTLEQASWDALRVAYMDIGAAVESYVLRCENEKRDCRKYAIYCTILAEMIGAENVEEVEADYLERWRGHAAMMSWQYRLNYINNYIARYSQRTPLSVYDECNQRYEEIYHATNDSR